MESTKIMSSFLVLVMILSICFASADAQLRCLPPGWGCGSGSLLPCCSFRCVGGNPMNTWGGTCL
ncbi:hypothetical protein MKW98_021551 [Papaver atlanticum]|uniref:Uncharacterized protein n=1 Tax=Papaver atlanticum TaxID=357466 RepID=A0AAD4TBZ8_9MAGN|nr:hypothetical protein MKW98_021551 [Papaver atlanticum]